MVSRKAKLFLSVVPAILLLLAINAEKGLMAQTFGAKLSLGNNWSQINGLDKKGLNRPGLYLGAGINHSKEGSQAEWQVEMIYIKTGWAENFTFIPEKNLTGLELRFVEIPFSLAFMDWGTFDRNGREFYRMRYRFGLSPIRLLRIKMLDYSPAPDFEDSTVSSAFRSYGLIWKAGVSFFFLPDWAINLDFARSILPLIASSEARDFQLGEIRQSYLSVGLSFHL